MMLRAQHTRIIPSKWKDYCRQNQNFLCLQSLSYATEEKWGSADDLAQDFIWKATQTKNLLKVNELCHCHQLVNFALDVAV